jgi:hypothetical protein
MTITTKLQIPTADNTNIRIDTIFFTADNSCLVNGGEYVLKPLKGQNYQPNVDKSGIVRF